MDRELGVVFSEAFPDWHKGMGVVALDIGFGRELGLNTGDLVRLESSSVESKGAALLKVLLLEMDCLSSGPGENRAMIEPFMPAPLEGIAALPRDAEGFRIALECGPPEEESFGVLKLANREESELCFESSSDEELATLSRWMDERRIPVNNGYVVSYGGQMFVICEERAPFLPSAGTARAECYAARLKQRIRDLKEKVERIEAAERAACAGGLEPRPKRGKKGGLGGQIRRLEVLCRKVQEWLDTRDMASQELLAHEQQILLLSKGAQSLLRSFQKGPCDERIRSLEEGLQQLENLFGNLGEVFLLGGEKAAGVAETPGSKRLGRADLEEVSFKDSEGEVGVGEISWE